MNVMLVLGTLHCSMLYVFLLRPLLLLVVVVAQDSSVSPPSIALTAKISSLGSITDIQYAPGDGDGPTRLFVVTREGQIKIVESVNANSATVRPTPFLDISSRVKSASERGLLGLAFHPDYATNGYVFVNYIYLDPNQPEVSCQNNRTPGNGKNTRISRFTATISTSTVDPTTELVIAEIEQPYCNHNGGQMRFGVNDGYLYLGLGDGGNAGDPQNKARDLTTYLGKLLRVDVNDMDGSSSTTVTVHTPRWKIPPDNPMASCTAIDPNALGEIIGYGLRNPWRFTFDRMTGDLWIADVGQYSFEEVNLIPNNDIVRSCHNFGWNDCEGTRLFTDEGKFPSQCSSCSDPSCFVVPVLGYGRVVGGSVTGGHVYRGQAYASQLNGVYFYADFVSGHIWGAARSSVSITGTTFSNVIQELNILSSPTTFGEDVNGELFVGNLAGTLYRIEAQTPSPTPMTVPGPGPLVEIVKCPTSSLENSLDITANLRFSYQVMVPDNDADIAAYGGVLCAELIYRGNNAWIALAMTETGTMAGSQAIIGRPDENSVQKYNLISASIGLASSAQTLRDTMIEQQQQQTSTGTTTTTTRMRFTKILKEEGEIEIDGNGLNTFLWAHGISNTFVYHERQNRGSFNVILRPMVKPGCHTWLEWLYFLIRIITFGLVDFC